MDVLEVEAASRSAVAERRRPGRQAHVSPELIPLLRSEAPVVLEPEIQFGEPDQLRSARGVTLAVAISAALWAAMAYSGYWLFS
jgi:hypothetical protein